MAAWYLMSCLAKTPNPRVESMYSTDAARWRQEASTSGANVRADFVVEVVDIFNTVVVEWWWTNDEHATTTFSSGVL
jgi:hypothetical protein